MTEPKGITRRQMSQLERLEAESIYIIREVAADQARQHVARLVVGTEPVALARR